MRIRKHAKISPLKYTHICQFNQSPWDVITFPIEDPSLVQPPPPSSNFQFDGYVDGTTASTRSMKLDEMKEINCSNYLDSSVAKYLHNSSDDKINKGKDKGVEMDELGLVMEEYNNTTILCNNKKPEKQHEAVDVLETRSTRRLPARSKKSSSLSSSTNPHEFYYYSGFGPLWGKKRSAKRNDPKIISIPEDAEKCPSSQVDNEEINNVELGDKYDHHHHQEKNGKKKRPRKLKN